MLVLLEPLELLVLLVPLVRLVLPELLVLLVRLDPLVEVEAAPRRVVVDEPSELTVLVVVRDVPLVLTRDVVVVEVGVTFRVEVELPVDSVRLVLLVLPEVCVVRLVELELLVVLEELVFLEVLAELVLLVELLVCVVRLVEVLPVVVVVVLFDATRFCRSRALLISDVRLVPPLSALAMRFWNDCSG